MSDHVTKQRRSRTGRKDREGRTLAATQKRNRWVHDKLTAIWRKASSLLASFDDELA